MRSRVRASTRRGLGATRGWVATKLCYISDRWLDGTPLQSRAAQVLLRVANVLTPSRIFKPIVWLADYAPVAQFAAEENEISVGPTIDGVAMTKPIVLPAVRLYRFTEVTVTARAPVFVTDGSVVIERAEVVDPERLESFGGHLLSEGRHLGIIEKRHPEVAVERGFFLGGYGYFNYYHWLIELLPKLHYWSTAPHELRGYPLLVGEAVYGHQALVDALQCWVTDPEVIILKDDLSYRVGDLLHINAPNTGPFNLLEGEEVRVEDCLLRPEAVGVWRERMGPRAQKVDGGGLRLFLARDGSRRAYNQDDVLEVFLCEGFQPVYLEQLSLNEQMRLLAAAEFVVGPSGAA
jgi:hypothetical protein